jgi:hypothetical protein
MSPIANKEQYNATLERLSADSAYRASPEGRQAEQALREFHAQYTQQREQEAASFREGLDLTPTQAPEANIRVMVPGGGIVRRPGTQEAPTETGMLENAAARGVDIQTGAPASIRAKAGLLGSDPEAAALALEGLISEELKKAGVSLPEGVPSVFQDESTGRLAYFRPQPDGTLKPTLVNPPGIEMGDLGENAPGAVALAAEVGASIGGAMAGGAAGGVPGAVAGATGATAVAVPVLENARKEIARSFGVPEEAVEQITNDEILKKTLMSAGFEAAVPGAMGLVNRVRNRYIVGGGRFTDEDITQFEKLLGEQASDLAQLAQRTGVRLEGDVAAATGDPYLIAMGSLARSRARGGEALARSVADIQARFDETRALDSLLGNNVPGAPVLLDPATAGAAVKTTLRQPLEAAEARLARRETGLEEAAGRIRVPSTYQTYSGVQEDLAGRYRNLEATEESAWGRFRSASGYNADTGVSSVALVNTGETPVKQALASLDEQGQQALSASLEASQRSFVSDLGYRVPDAKTVEEDAVLREVLANPNARPEMVQRAQQYLSDTAATPPMTPERMMQDTLDLNQLHFLLSHLKKEKRAIQNNASALGWRTGDLNKVISAVETQIRGGGMVNRTGGQPLSVIDAAEVSSSFLQANAATVNKAMFNENKVARELISADSNGKFKTSPEAIRGMLFTRGNPTNLNAILGTTGPSPSARAGLLGELESLYKATVLPEGRFSQAAHDNFMRDYSGHLRILTGREAGTPRINNVAEFGALVRQAENTAKSVQASLKKTFGDALSNDNQFGTDIAKALFSGGQRRYTPDQVNELVRRLNRDAPELLGDIRYHTSDFIRSRMVNKDGQLDAGALNAFLNNNRANLTSLYGGDYVAGLDLLNRHMQRSLRAEVGKAPVEELQTPAMMAFRTLFGPLSTTQRRLTALQRADRSFKQSSLLNMVGDPEALRKYLQLNRQTPGSIARLNTFLELGASIDDLPERDQEMVQLIRQRNPNFGL